MVRGIVIPSAEQRDPEVCSFESFGDLQEAVDGWSEAVDVTGAGVTLLVNGEGVPRGLPFNRRATYFWWHFVPRAAGHARLLGDVVLVGWSGTQDQSTDAPAEFVRAIAPGREYQVELRRCGFVEWRSDAGGRQSYFEAIVWACLVVEIGQGEAEAQVVLVA